MVSEFAPADADEGSHSRKTSFGKRKPERDNRDNRYPDSKTYINATLVPSTIAPTLNSNDRSFIKMLRVELTKSKMVVGLSYRKEVTNGRSCWKVQFGCQFFPVESFSVVNSQSPKHQSMFIIITKLPSLTDIKSATIMLVDEPFAAMWSMA